MDDDMSMTEAVQQIQGQSAAMTAQQGVLMPAHWREDRKSTRLNSSHT